MKNDEMKRSGLNRFVRADENFGKAMQDFCLKFRFFILLICVYDTGEV